MKEFPCPLLVRSSCALFDSDFSIFFQYHYLNYADVSQINFTIFLYNVFGQVIVPCTQCGHLEDCQDTVPETPNAVTGFETHKFFQVYLNAVTGCKTQ